MPLAHLATLPPARLTALTPSLLVVVCALVPMPTMPMPPAAAPSCMGSPLTSSQHPLPTATFIMSDAAVTSALMEDIAAHHRLIGAKRRPRGDRDGSSPVHLFPEILNPADDAIASSGFGLNLETFRAPTSGRIYMQLVEAPTPLPDGSAWLDLSDLLLAQLSAAQPYHAAALAWRADVAGRPDSSSRTKTATGALVLRQLLALSTEAGQGAARAASHWGDPGAKEECVRLAGLAGGHICESRLRNCVLLLKKCNSFSSPATTYSVLPFPPAKASSSDLRLPWNQMAGLRHASHSS